MLAQRDGRRVACAATLQACLRVLQCALMRELAGTDRLQTDREPRCIHHHEHARQTTMGLADQPAQGTIEIERTRCRSEEHTSELQSLMRISYAVFCLKKK